MTDHNGAQADTAELVYDVMQMGPLPAHFLLGGKMPKPGDGLFLQLLNGSFVVGLYVMHNFGHIVLDKPVMPIIKQTQQGATIELIPFGAPFLSIGFMRRALPLAGIMQAEYCHDKRLLDAVANLNFDPAKPKIHKAPASAMDSLNEALKNQRGG